MHAEKDPFTFLPPPITSLDSESVHQLRKGTKQLRAKLHLLKNIEGPQEDREHLRQTVKDLASLLSGHRDYDVMSALLQELTADIIDDDLKILLESFQDKLNVERQPKPPVQRISKLVREINKNSRKVFKDEPDQIDITNFLAPQLTETDKAGQALLSATSTDWEALHNWRKQVKQLMYQFKLKPTPSHWDLVVYEKLEELGDCLGKINDLKILKNYTLENQDQCTRASTLDVYGRLHQEIDRRMQVLVEKCRGLLVSISKLH